MVYDELKKKKKINSLEKWRWYSWKIKY
jgi:hypothetical protein